MPQSWYLAADFQCQVMSMLLLILIWKHPQYAKPVMATVLFACILIPFIQTYMEKLDPLILLYPE
jgi:peptidoglycan/LPS O-acetylase OafA/YrhL